MEQYHSCFQQRRLELPARNSNRGYSTAILPSTFYRLPHTQLSTLWIVGAGLAPDEFTGAYDRECTGLFPAKEIIRRSCDCAAGGPAICGSPSARRVGVLD